MLKTIEEPPPSTHFVVLADFVPNDLVTIASRCVRIEFSPIPAAVLVERLVAEGVDADARRRRPRRPPAATSTGPACSSPTTNSSPDATRSPACRQRSTAPARPWSPRWQICSAGSRRPPRRSPPPRTRAGGAREPREAARHAGQRPGASSRPATSASCAATAPTSCAAVSRSSPAPIATRSVADTAPHPNSVVDAVHRIHHAIEALDNNPNETLLLQSLLWSLPPLT